MFLRPTIRKKDGKEHCYWSIVESRRVAGGRVVQRHVLYLGEITIDTLPGGGWRFLHPDGRHFEVIRCTHTVSYDGEELESTHAELGISIDSDTAATRWRGERMDYDLGVWVLCNQANRAREVQDVSAETFDA